MVSKNVRHDLITELFRCVQENKDDEGDQRELFYAGEENPIYFSQGQYNHYLSFSNRLTKTEPFASSYDVAVMKMRIDELFIQIFSGLDKFGSRESIAKQLDTWLASIINLPEKEFTYSFVIDNIRLSKATNFGGVSIKPLKESLVNEIRRDITRKIRASITALKAKRT